MLKTAGFIILLIVGMANANRLPVEVESATSNGKAISLKRVAGEFDYIEPSFSPDGQRFVYVRRWQGLWMANIDGSNQVLLQEPTAPINMLAWPRWSPDGTRIAYNAAVGHSGESGDGSVWILDIATRKASRIFSNLKIHGPWESSCAWSPDGTKIAATIPADPKPYIAILELSSGNITELHPELKGIKFPDWSPAGEHILVGGDSHDTGELWLVPLSGGPPQPLNTGEVGGKIARYSPDGEWIAFEAHSMVDSARNWRSKRIALVSSDGGTPVYITSEKVFGPDLIFSAVQSPSWSPDSRTILAEFRKVHDDETAAKTKINTLAIVDTSGGNYRVLVENETDLDIWARVSWAPDEKMIAYTRAVEKDTTVRIVDLSNGVSEIVTDGKEPTWSADGNEIAFSRGGNIWTRDVQTGHEYQITLNLQKAARPTWSPVGDLIAFKQEREIWLVSAYGGEAERLAEYAGLINWADNGSALFGHSNKSNTYKGIWGDVWIYKLANKPNAGTTWGGSQGHVPYVAGDGSFVVSCHLVEGEGLIIQEPGKTEGRVFFNADDGRYPLFPTVSPSQTKVAFFLTEDFWDPTAWLIDINQVLRKANALP